MNKSCQVYSPIRKQMFVILTAAQDHTEMRVLISKINKMPISAKDLV